MVALPYTLTNGTQIDATQLMSNLTTLRDAHDQVRNANVVDNAGIDKSKLAQSGNVNHNSFPLVPYTSGADLATPAGFTLPAALTTIHKTRMRMAAGQLGAVCAVDADTTDVTVGGSTWPELNILIDGVQFMGQAVQLDTDSAQYVFGNSNPIANPGYPISADSVIEYQLRRNGAGAPTIRGLGITETTKRDLVAM